MTEARGGYLVHNASLIRAMGGEHTSSLERPVSQADLDALNSVQRVPWRINRSVHVVAAAALDAGLSIAGLVTQPPPAAEPKLPDAVWDAMDTEARQAHVAARRLKHTAYASATGKRHAALDKLGVAEELIDQRAIWYPHSRDFRGRLYPIPNHGPQPQGDDLSKSLIEFASGKPLGGSGLYWLLVRAANHAGQDKLPLDERMAWTLDRAEAVCAYAADPLENTGWADMEEPWQFLATCFELAEALYLDDASTFVSHLPVSLDGTCNGLQHLSALGRDRLGGEAVNLTANPERQDIYQRVADAVAAAVELDAAMGKPEALAWRGLVGRKVVKRAVMTTPYGVTKRGIRTQLIQDGHVPGEGKAVGENADYMRDQVVAALDETIAGARKIMSWMQSCAEVLTDVGLPLTWTTPSGSRVCQSYNVPTQSAVTTLLGRVQIDKSGMGSQLAKRKQMLGAAPNIVHSFDAAHLALTVNQCVAEGVVDLAMIHDSFATHAGSTDRLGMILRETFAAIYAEDWLAKLYLEFQGAAPAAEMPVPPETGDFDVSEVVRAPFFFS